MSASPSKRYGFGLTLAILFCGGYLIIRANATRAEWHEPHPITQRSGERQALYEWFDEFGHPEHATKPFFNIETSPRKIISDFENVDYGFLVSQDSKGITIQTLEGRILTFSPDQWVRLIEISLDDWLAEQKANVVQMQSGGVAFAGASAFPTFVNARWADLRGLPSLADFFYSRAEAWPRMSSYIDSHAFVETLRHDCVDEQFQLGVADLNDSSISRAYIASNLNRILSRYPDPTNSQQASTLVQDLVKMAQEDRARKPLSDVALKGLNPQDQAQELVWQLRNQTGFEWVNPGNIDVFARTFGEGKTPADKLLRLGYASVPALVVALDDNRPIRATDGREWGSAGMRVRDASIEILNAIARRDFGADSLYRRYDERELISCKKKVKSWWASVRKSGMSMPPAYTQRITVHRDPPR